MAMLIRIWAGGLVIVWAGNGFRTHKKLEGRNLDHYTTKRWFDEYGDCRDFGGVALIWTKKGKMVLEPAKSVEVAVQGRAMCPPRVATNDWDHHHHHRPPCSKRPKSTQLDYTIGTKSLN